MSATVTINGRERSVKNLGWLLRHWRAVSGFVVTTCDDTPYPGAILTATLRGGGHYTTRFASANVLRGWLPRPVFDGLPVVWDGVTCEIRRGWYA